VELVGDLARGARTGAEKVEDFSPRFVGKGAKDRVGRSPWFFHD
jgi:hypothetical protein